MDTPLASFKVKTDKVEIDRDIEKGERMVLLWWSRKYCVCYLYFSFWISLLGMIFCYTFSGWCCAFTTVSGYHHLHHHTTSYEQHFQNPLFTTTFFPRYTSSSCHNERSNNLLRYKIGTSLYQQNENIGSIPSDSFQSYQYDTNSSISSKMDPLWETFWNQHPFEIVEDVVKRICWNDEKQERMIFRTSDWNPKIFSTTIGNNDHNNMDNSNFSCLYDGNLQSIHKNTESSSSLEKKRNNNNNNNNIETKKRKSISFRLDLSYSGQYFCGWQCQPNNILLPSVQKTIEDSMNRAGCGKVNIRVSGRTDAGVHAIGQVARVRIPHAFFLKYQTMTKSGDDGFGMSNVDDTTTTTSVDHNEQRTYEDVVHSILQNAAAECSYYWKCRSVTEETHLFHPTFDSSSRSYAYIIDASKLAILLTESGIEYKTDTYKEYLVSIVERLNRLLNTLEGKALDYVSFSYGKVMSQSTMCCLTTARAKLLEYQVDNREQNTIHDDTLSSKNQLDSNVVLVIELTGDRFLRRMVRILVATALFHAVNPLLQHWKNMSGNATSTIVEDYYDNYKNDDDEILVHLCEQKNRQCTERPAPPGGLVFVHATMME